MAYVLDPNAGWNAGARSKKVCIGDCVATFRVPAGSGGVVCGFNMDDRTTDFREIRHALYMTSGKIYVYESGVQKTTAQEYGIDDVLSLRRVGGTVTYWKGSDLLYTSDVPSNGPVFLDCSLYLAGDTIL